MQFDSTYNQTCGIDITYILWEEFFDELILALLQTLHAKGHTAKLGDLILGIAEGQMAQETLVVLVNLVVDKCFLTG